MFLELSRLINFCPKWAFALNHIDWYTRPKNLLLFMLHVDTSRNQQHYCISVKWENVPSLEKWPMRLTGANWTGFAFSGTVRTDPALKTWELTPTGQLWGREAEIDIVPNLPLICGCHRWIVGSNWGVGREAWWVIGGLATSGRSATHQVD